jgi:hypothetical protein
MPEVLLFNPRRKKARKHTTKRKVKRHRAHRALSNPVHRKRRRVRSVRRVRRHVRHNPALRGGNLMQGVSFAVGAVASKVGGALVAKWIPAGWGLNADMTRIAGTAAVGIGAPLLMKQFKLKLLPGNLMNAWLMGGIVVTALDLFDTYIKPKLTFLSDYEHGQVGEYVAPAGLMGDGEDENVYGGGPY